ncbi:HupE/UreJ family protein [Ciceribacter sp. L1K23]|uniref:HupE/UreJ family protein n=1 Tax=unclassified Ciceribacter TaxID=2628820 RepID=UPI001ABDC20A|nr:MULTISPECIES: HupE/UreJ family protein [unclassified Ciceribacter]MBO3759203.1 HupE/UreJ family protein [Ciceribacter sp. L1K22]MBR0556649.1 HupE/UreJ family protein [Ciceribacter sp. L1K23]
MPVLRPFPVARVRQVLFHVATVTTILVATAGTADAHVLGGAMGGFGSGFEHPLLGPDHLLAMLAVGLWGAQLGGRSVWSLPATFPLIMCIGGIVGMTELFPIPFMELGIGLSVLVLGLAIAAAWKAPEFVALLLVSVFAIFHGYAHGQELPGAADPAAYAVGFVVATGLIHVAGVVIGMVLGRIREGRVVRLLGALIALCGVYFAVSAVV